MTTKNASEFKGSWRRYALLLVLLGLASLVWLTNFVWPTEGGVTPQQDTQVGVTSDDCSPARVVRFRGKDGEVIVKPGESKRVVMPSLMSEFHWFCGDSRERVANDDHFNVVKISRAHESGSIFWKFYKAAPQPPSGSNQPELVRVGDTKDACDGQRAVQFASKHDAKFKVSANQSKLVELSGLRNTLDWNCVQANGTCPQGDVCDEHSSNPVSFNWVQIDRAGNGAISWIFYRQKNESTPGTPDVPATPPYVHNATGDLRVILSLPGKPTEQPFDKGFLKAKFDDFWNEHFDENRQKIIDVIKEKGDEAAKKFGASFQLNLMTMSDTNRNELRTAAKDGTLWLKYVAHHNVVNCRFLKGALEPKFTIRFDIQLEMALPQVSPDKPPQASKAPLRLAHTEVEGDNLFGDIVQEIFKSKLQGVKTEANAFSQDFTKEINDALKKDWPPAPEIPKSIKSELSVSRAGTVRFCLRSSGAPECDFGPLENPHMPKVLDETGGGCGSALLWIRDAETQRFTSIAKGQHALIEVESRRFDWYCGGSQGPETQEFESGPVGTYFARVSRNSTGGGINFKFLAWR
jgi:hypothetical protein